MKPITFRFADNDLLRRFFRDILTGKDGDSFDMGRVLGAFGFIGYMLFGMVQMFMTVYAIAFADKPEWHEFPFLSFAGGFTAIATGAGALIWMKKDTEPGQPPGPPPAGPTTTIEADRVTVRP